MTHQNSSSCLVLQHSHCLMYKSYSRWLLVGCYWDGDVWCYWQYATEVDESSEVAVISCDSYSDESNSLYTCSGKWYRFSPDSVSAWFLVCVVYTGKFSSDHFNIFFFSVNACTGHVYYFFPLIMFSVFNFLSFSVVVISIVYWGD